MRKDWWMRKLEQTSPERPDESHDLFRRALETARAREQASRPLFDQLALAMRTAESEVPIDRATVPLHMALGPEKVKELAAQIRISPYLRTNIQALVHHYQEDRRELQQAMRAAAMLEASPDLFVRPEAVQLLFRLFHFLPASRERFRDYPLFYHLFGGADETSDGGCGAVPDDLRFFLAEQLPADSAAAVDGAVAVDMNGSAPTPLEILDSLAVAPVTLEVGLDLIPLVDPVLGGQLMTRIAVMRAGLADEIGFVLPGVTFKDNFTLAPGAYRLLFRGNVVAAGELMVGHFLTVETPRVEAHDSPPIGFPAVDPVFGGPATWVTRLEGRRAAQLGYAVYDPTQVLLCHLEEVIRTHGHEVLGLQEVAAMLDRLRERMPETVEAVVPGKLEIGDYQLILRNLLRERVSIRDQATILERLAQVAKPIHPFYLADRFGPEEASLERLMLLEMTAQVRPLCDPQILTEMVRVALSRQICAALADETGALEVVVLEGPVEAAILDGIQTTATGQTLVLSASTRELVVSRLMSACQRLERPVVLCGGRIRPFVKQLMARPLPRLAVLSHAEVHPEFPVQSVGAVSLIER